MLTTIIILLLVICVSTLILMKKGKVADKNKNNIPDVVEHAANKFKETANKVKKATIRKKSVKK